MNEIQGYYSLSVNPSYISTWYTPFFRKNNKRFIDARPVEPSSENFKSLLSSDELAALSDFNVLPEAKKIPVNLADNSHHGRISPTAMKKIKQAIDYAVYLAKPQDLPTSFHGKHYQFRLNFITLTLSSKQIHDDREIKKNIFEPMLNTFRQKYRVINYIWRAEKQGNGNIHFHIVTDKFIPWKKLREDWNNHQNALGYIDRYRLNMLEYHKNGFHLAKDLLSSWSYYQQKEAYIQGCKNEWNSPNSTDIHSLKTISNVKEYFVKYMTKDEQSDENRQNKQGQFSDLSGRLWGCSSRLTKLSGGRDDIDYELSDELLRLKNDYKCRTFEKDFFTISFVSVDYLKLNGYNRLFSIFSSYIHNLFPEYFPPDLFGI